MAALRASCWRSGVPGQDDIAGLQSRVALRQTEQGPTGADLDVIGMRTDREHGQRPVLRHRQTQWQHACLPWCRRYGNELFQAQLESDRRYPHASSV